MRRQTYEVPSKDREIFIDPPPGRILELIHSNKSKFGKGVLQYAPIICGIPFRKFRSMVRREVLQKAIEYTKKITGNEQRATSDETIIQTGYQPTFYHPGIWLKNHLAYHIAKRVNGTSINISIDNDVCHENWIYVPTPTHPSPLEGEDKVGGREITLEKIEFVERGANLAFEALSFGDANRVISFRDKVLACLNRSVSGGSETFEKFANLMIDASIRLRRTNIGEILTIARRKFEDSFGIYNLEVPVSKICECDSFLIFFLAILSDCRRFASIYNCTLGFYRKAHKLRSKAQPLPDLMVDKNMVEVPFWAWRRGEPRKRLFVSAAGGADNKHVDLIYENQVVLAFDIEGKVGVETQLVRLKELVNSGIKIRPRAITNTMFSRLFFSDLFIHGIGGARYDVITNSLIKDFFGVEPPDFLTASATLYLPFQGFDIIPLRRTDLNAHRLLLRDMHYNPEKYLAAHLKTDKEISTLIMEKQKIIGSTWIQNHTEQLRNFKRIREINSILECKLLPYSEQEKTELKRMERLVLQNEIMRNRTYPFCIYPESLLKDFYGKHSLLPGW